MGSNSNGNLGISEIDSSTLPIDITSEFGFEVDEVVINIGTSSNSSMVLTSKGNIFTWGYGYNSSLACGITDSVESPTNVLSYFSLDDDEMLVSAYLNGYSGYAISSKGKILAWGYNSYGELGDGTTYRKYQPTKLNHLLSEGISVKTYITDTYNYLNDYQVLSLFPNYLIDSGLVAVEINNTMYDITSIDLVQNRIDTSKAGTYTIIYKVTDASGNESIITRYVTVLEKTANYYFEIDSSITTLSIGDSYQESICMFIMNGVSYNCEQSNNIDLNTVGIYEITYTYTQDDIDYMTKRYVFVYNNQEKPVLFFDNKKKEGLEA